MLEETETQRQVSGEPEPAGARTRTESQACRCGLERQSASLGLQIAGLPFQEDAGSPDSAPLPPRPHRLPGRTQMPTRKASITTRETAGKDCDKGWQVALVQGRCPQPGNSPPEESKNSGFRGMSHNSVALQNSVGGKKKYMGSLRHRWAFLREECPAALFL